MQLVFDSILKDKIKRAIAIIRHYESYALSLSCEGYYLATSFGKDSIVLHHLAEQANVQYQAYNAITTIDPPELVKFGRKYYPNVIREKPNMSMWQLMRHNKFPPTRLLRYCCRELKDCYGSGRVVLTGIRQKESSR